MTWAWGLSERRPAWQYFVPPILIFGGFFVVGWDALSPLARGLGAILFITAVAAWGWKVEGARSN